MVCHSDKFIKMKHKIFLIALILFFNFKLNAQTKLGSYATTQDANSTYPTHLDTLGQGGLMTVSSIASRNSILVRRRKQGMMVYVQANDSLYKLTTADVSLNTGWVAMGLLTQQKLSDSLNARLKAIDTLSLSARIDLKANAGTISDVTVLLAEKLKITDTSLLLQKADTASLSNRINVKANTTDFNSLTTTVGTKFKTTDTSYLLQKADTVSLSNRINLKLDVNKIGVKNGVASLNAVGVIPSDQIPPISFSSVDVVNSQAEMLSFTNGMGLPTDRLVGSIVVRIDSSKNFVLARQPASVRANWTELLTPAPPVQSVNGHLGTVSVTPLDLHLDSVDNIRDIDKPVSTLTLNALALKLKITDTSYLLQKADTIRLSNRIVSSVASITAETTRATGAETTLTNKVNANTSSITSNLNSIVSLNTNVSANTSSITSLNTKINSNTASITANTSDILLRATISSPSFTGTPTSTTAPALTNTTQLATTAFVRTAVTNLTGLNNSNLSGTAGITDANLATISTAGKVSNSATSATASNTSYTIVARDAVGDFSANNITASLNGTALLATNLEGGAAGSIPYQTANNTTGLLAKGTNGQFLQLTSGIPSWQTLSTSVNASSITGTVAVANGGTGQTSIAGIQSAIGLTGVRVAIGSDAGKTAQGSQSIAIGSSAGTFTQSAYAVAVGSGAGQNSQGIGSIAIGSVTAQTNQGAYSIAIGSNAAQNGQGTQSVAVGFAANSGGNNAIGLGTYSSAGGNNSTAIGYYASAGYANSTAIGYQASSTAPNTIQLGADGVTIAGSTAVTNVKTSGTLTAGTVTYPNTHGNSGEVLTTAGSGTLTWTVAYTPTDATTSTKGIILLSGDLRGSAKVPTVNSVGGVSSSTIATFDTRITSATNSITSNTASITSNTASINTLNTNVTSNTASITSLNTSILASTISGTVAINKGGTGQTDIAGIKSVLGLSGSKVAIGSSAGITAQGDGTVAVGTAAGSINQGASSVAIGSNAAQSGQGTQSIAIGVAANSNGNNAIGIGAFSIANGDNATGIGAFSIANGNNSTAIGYEAFVTDANTIQLGADGVSVIGSTAVTNVKTSATLTAGTVTYPNRHGNSGEVLTTTGSGTLTWTVAYTPTNASTTSKGIIQLAGDLRGTATSPTVNTVGGVNSATIATFDTRITSATNSITSSIANLSGSRVAIGTQAGTISQSTDAVAIGTQAGKNTQGTNSVGLGTNAGLNLQGAQSVAIGPYAGQDNQQGFSVAIGYVAGGTNQAAASVAIGAGSGSNNQNGGAVALGSDAGNTSQGSHSVAIGYLAGNANQGDNSVAIGSNAAQTGQGQNAVAIGISSSSAANYSTAIGPNTAAGFTNSTAIGYQATATAANTIQLGNSSVTNVNTSGAVNAKSYYLNASSAITAAASTTIDLSLSNIFKVSLGTDIGALSFTNAKPGTYIIEFIQGGTYNVTFPTTNWKWAAGLIPIITQTSGKIDIVTLVYDGTYYFASTVQNF